MRVLHIERIKMKKKKCFEVFIIDRESDKNWNRIFFSFFFFHDDFNNFKRAEYLLKSIPLTNFYKPQPYLTMSYTMSFSEFL